MNDDAAILSEADAARGDARSVGDGYLRRAGVHDEMVDGDGHVRAVWRPLIDAWSAMDADARTQIGADARRALDEAGLAYNPWADTGPAARQGGGPGPSAAPWRFDHVPVMISSEDWALLSAAAEQRARLVEATLGDVYGARSLVASGALPPAVVFGSPNYLREAAGWDHPPKRRLLRYAVDVARTAEGEWVVLDDVVDSPEGEGWALANRIALGQAASELFVASGARRLGRWFETLREALEADTGPDGRMGCLTDGPADPSYFSHAFLARYLGLTLVEPGDLAVRDGEAHVKTLEGLRRLDVILRGAPSVGVDPLYAPRLGVGPMGPPAILRAARAGRLTFANAVGSGVAQGRALAPFSTALARRLLGEELLLPEAPCLWLGAPEAQERFLREPEAWRVTELDAPSRPGARLAAPLEVEGREGLARRLRREGWRMVARAPVETGAVPVAAPGGLAAASWAMRLFVTAGPTGYQCMPGGLAFATGAEPVTGLPWRGVSKDVWVVDEAGAATGPTAAATLTRRRRTAHLQRTGRELLSRVADDLFWLGRYGERGDLTLRVLKVVLERMIDAPRRAEEPALLHRLLSLRLEPDDAEATRETDEPPEDLRTRLMRLAIDDAEPESARRAVDALYWNANRARAHLSRDAWRDVGALHAMPLWRTPADPSRALGLAGPVEEAVRCLAAFAGASHENMTRNFAWRFLELGRRLQRGLNVVHLFRRLVAASEPDEAATLYALLLICDSFFAYRSRYLTTPEATPVIDLLILDEANPRSLAFQVAQAEAALGELPRPSPYRNPEHRIALRLLTELRVADAATLGEGGEDGRREALAALLEQADKALIEISDLVAKAYFAHAEPAMTQVMAARMGATQ